LRARCSGRSRLSLRCWCCLLAAAKHEHGGDQNDTQ
jgi:hypothetical protein